MLEVMADSQSPEKRLRDLSRIKPVSQAKITGLNRTRKVSGWKIMSNRKCKIIRRTNRPRSRKLRFVYYLKWGWYRGRPLDNQLSLVSIQLVRIASIGLRTCFSSCPAMVWSPCGSNDRKY